MKRAKPETAPKAAQTVPVKLGRKRDESLDGEIVEAALAILSEVGFDSMTMDAVAARVGAGKATLYRRWPSKAELVRDALIRMGQSSVDTRALPDTGVLRSDLLALMKPYTNDFAERKIRILTGLGSFFTSHQKLAQETINGIFDPWTAVNRQLMKRAQERKEIPAGADIDRACEIIVSLVYFKTSVQFQKFDKADYAALLDNILLPALKKG